MADEIEALHPHVRLIRDYLSALENNADGATLAGFFAPDATQHEFPNRFVEQGASHDLSQVLERSRKGRQVVQKQSFAIKNALVDGDRVAIELTWTAELKVPLGKLPVGGSMSANCGVFFRLRDGRIVEQHNFDCFDPF